MRRVLVTGGAGFVGSHIADALVAAGVEVVVLDVAEHDPVDARSGARDGVRSVRGDIRDRAVVERCLDGVDAVCHQAAMVGLGVDLGDLPGYVSHNDVGTASLLAAIHRVGGVQRLVLASSMVVYGEGGYRCRVHGEVRPGPRAVEDLDAGRFEPRCPVCDEELEIERVTESAPLDPRNVYAATKVHQEHLCSAFSRETGVPVTALRYHNVYGPRMPLDTPYAGVAAIFRSALQAGRAPRVLEDGRQRRDFVHVRDVARANVRALTAERPVTGPFNVASGDARTVGEMAHALVDAFGPNAPRPVVVGGYRLGDVRHIVASPERARAILDFKARVPFAEGVREFARSPLRGAGLEVPTAG
ncbi:MAG: NAD-dependent epimerase/dehydratase family protein [Actinomycetota bacterium]